MLAIKFVSFGEKHPRSFIVTGARIIYEQFFGDADEKTLPQGLGGETIFGKAPDASNNQHYSYFGGRILTEENEVIMDFLVFPRTHCYIMNSEGKTVDTFTSQYVPR